MAFFSGSRIVLLSVLALFMTAAPCGAQETIASLSRGECVLSIEAGGTALIVRSVHPGETRGFTCDTAREDLEALLGAACGMRKGADGVDRPTVVFLGRAVRHSWIAGELKRLSAASPDWNAKQGKPKKGNANEFVQDLLLPVVAPLNASLATCGVEVSGISAEKVLVPVRPDETGARLPEDAILWLLLKPSGGGTP